MWSHFLPWKQKSPEVEPIPSLLLFHQALPGTENAIALSHFTLFKLPAPWPGIQQQGPHHQLEEELQSHHQSSPYFLKFIKMKLPKQLPVAPFNASLSLNCQHSRHDATRPGSSNQCALCTVGLYSVHHCGGTVLVQLQSGRQLYSRTKWSPNCDYK